MGLLYRSKRRAWARSRLALLGHSMLAATGSGCHKDAEVTTQVVTLHVPPGCTSTGQILDEGGYATFAGLGDFEPNGGASGHLLSDTGDWLSEIDPASRVIQIGVTEGAGNWLGAADIPPAGNLDVLLLPLLSSCPLPPPGGGGAGIPVGSGATIASAGSDQILAIGGQASAEGGSIPETYVARLNADVVAPATPPLLTPRTQASVTSFGTGALVAGGSDRYGQALDTAEIYAPAAGGFQQQAPILLSEPRTDHGAAVLTTGETLLVGGIGGADGATVLGSMEVVDPVTRTVRAENVAPLAVARRNASVLLLASGEILVAGGFDASGAPVTTLEWFSGDASAASKRPAELAAGSARSFIALQAGGALAVVAPPPSASTDFENVWVIDADGTLEAGQAIQGPLTHPVLFGGAGGAPVLWTGDRWLRWQPWAGSFAALGSLDATPARVGTATASGDPGLALWLDSLTSALTGLRFDSRGTYSPLTAPLLVDDAGDTAPDRLIGASGVSFDPTSGLTLVPNPNSSLEPGVFVTDRSYADLTVDLDVAPGQLPAVALRDPLGAELQVGGTSCPWPSTSQGPASIRVTRRGSSVAWALSTGASGTCPGGVSSTARLSIGLRAVGTSSPSVARNLRVTRP